MISYLFARKGKVFDVIFEKTKIENVSKSYITSMVSCLFSDVDIF